MTGLVLAEWDAAHPRQRGGPVIEWRLATPCPSVRNDGKSCEHEAGHDSDHVTSVWELAEDGEMYPNHPEYWR